MSKTVRIGAVAFLGLLLVSMGVWLMQLRRSNAEPVYQGKALSLWLEDLDSWNGNTNLPVFTALRAMGDQRCV